MNFEEQNGIKPQSDVHNTPNFSKDVKAVLDVLEDCDVFEKKPKRYHPSFRDFNAVLQQCQSKHLKQWISERVKSYDLL